MGELVIRNGLKFSGALGSGTGDNILTKDTTTNEVGEIASLDLSNYLSTTLSDGYILIGNSSNVATARQVTGDILITNTGLTSIAAGVIVNADVSSSAAIAYSKLNLATSIVNGDISASAAIGRSKLATGTAYRVLINDGTGAFSEASAITASRILVSDVDGLPTHVDTATYPSLTELARLKGVTSAIQTQFSNKLSFSSGISPAEGDLIQYTGGAWNRIAVGTNGQLLSSDGTNPVWVSDPPTGLPAGGDEDDFLIKATSADYDAEWVPLTLSLITDVTATVGQVNVLATGYYDATSSIQTQLNSKQSSTLAQHAIWVGNGSNLASPLAAGTDTYVLTSVGGVPQWAPPLSTFSTEDAQDAVGAMVDSTLIYTDGTPLLSRAALTGDITASSGSNATTLATVNGNVGSFGSATQVGTFTVNAKGLITAASNTTVTPAVSSITGFGTGITTWLATPSSANLATAVTDETGSGALVFATSPTLVTPALGTPSAIVLTNGTGLPLTTGVTGILPVPNGGTGVASVTANSYLKGNGTSALVERTYSEVRTDLSLVGVQDLYVPAVAMWPRITSGCAAITKTEMSTSLVNIQTLDFDQTSSEYAQFTISLPKNWNNGTVTATFYWTASSGSGTVTWGIQGGAYSDDDALTVALGTAQTVTDTLLATNDLHVTSATSAITLAGSPADADFLAFQIYRDVADSLSGDAKLLGVVIQLTTDAAISS